MSYGPNMLQKSYGSGLTIGLSNKWSDVLTIQTPDIKTSGAPAAGYAIPVVMLQYGTVSISVLYSSKSCCRFPKSVPPRSGAVGAWYVLNRLCSNTHIDSIYEAIGKKVVVLKDVDHDLLVVVPQATYKVVAYLIYTSRIHERPSSASWNEVGDGLTSRTSDSWCYVKADYIVMNAVQDSGGDDCRLVALYSYLEKVIDLARCPGSRSQ